MDRLAIYFFFDKDGIVDRYVGNILEELVKNTQRLIVVSNGPLIKESELFIKKYTQDLIIRENRGFDVWAYKTVMDSLGWEEILTFDEVILMNYTIMGPVYPLSEVFDTMDQKAELDFWGITKCFREDSKGAQEMWNNPYGYIPEHIQSSFTVFRKSIVSSLIFQQYWDNMPPILSYYESGGKHEQVITKYFADNGFKWDCYTQYDDVDYEYYGCCPLITFPLEVIKGKRSPFFKRRSFFTSKCESTSALPKAKELLDFLEKETTYDTSMIYENLIRTCNQRDLLEAFLDIHIKEQYSISREENPKEKSLAIFVNEEHIVEKDELKQSLQDFESIADIFWADGKSIGVSATNLFTGVKADYRNYEYVLVISPFEKETGELGTVYNIRQKYFVYNFLNTPDTLTTAVHILEKNCFEGMLATPIDYLKALHWRHYEKWNDLYFSVEHWLRQNSINSPISVNKVPIRGENGVFLVKVSSITGLDNLHFKNYTMEFFTYALPLFMQSNGILPAYFTDLQRIENNLFGYEAFAEWIPELKNIKEKFYTWREDYFQKIDSDNKSYISLCEKNLKAQSDYITSCEENLKNQSNYIASCEENLKNQSNYIASCKENLKAQQNHIDMLESLLAEKQRRGLKPLVKRILKITE
ncbi:MAG: hypothetical protein HFG42_18265 [Lachnospiraceae bacterium]|nr:hypothetical protein [Lachnospiraceae bacterium]